MRPCTLGSFGMSRGTESVTFGKRTRGGGLGADRHGQQPGDEGEGAGHTGGREMYRTATRVMSRT
jgi:hypothetical protein